MRTIQSLLKRFRTRSNLNPKVNVTGQGGGPMANQLLNQETQEAGQKFFSDFSTANIKSQPKAAASMDSLLGELIIDGIAPSRKNEAAEAVSALQNLIAFASKGSKTSVA
jgi:hypothetical protein